MARIYPHERPKAKFYSRTELQTDIKNPQPMTKLPYAIIVPLIAYGLLLAERDAFGVSNFLTSFVPSVYAISVGMLLILYCASLFHLHNQRKVICATLQWSIWSANFLIAVIFLSSFIKSFNLLNAMSLAMYDGIAIFVIWIAAFRDGCGMRFLIAYIFAQMTLAVSVLLNPSLEFINGRFYQSMKGSFTIDSSSQEGFVLDKLLVGEYGVFHNPNALGFYSVASLVCGIYFVMKGKKFNFFIGCAFIAMSTYGWINSLTRGPIIAVAAAFLLFYIAETFKQSQARFLFRLLVLFIALMSAYYLLIDFFEYIVPSVENASVSGRFDGYTSGWIAFINSPILGVDGTRYWEDQHIPHFLPLYMLANHGILAGVIAVFFSVGISTVVIISTIRLYVRYKGYEPVLRFSVSILLVCLSIALTNNTTSPFLFWAAFAQAIINYSSISDKLLRRSRDQRGQICSFEPKIDTTDEKLGVSGCPVARLSTR